MTSSRNAGLTLEAFVVRPYTRWMARLFAEIDFTPQSPRFLEIWCKRTCALNVSIDRCRKIAEGWDPARRTLGTLESRDKHEFRWRLAVLLREQNFRSSKREMKWLYDFCCSQILFWRFDGCKDFVCSRFLRNSLFVFWVASGRELIYSQENEFGMVRQGLLQHFVLAFIFLLVTVSTSQWGQTENLDVLFSPLWSGKVTGWWCYPVDKTSEDSAK